MINIHIICKVLNYFGKKIGISFVLLSFKIKTWRKVGKNEFFNT